MKWKWTALLIASIMLLSLCSSAQPNAYSAQNPGGAPTAIAPTSPDALGLQIPQITSPSESPAPQERSVGLMKSDQNAAYAAPKGLRATATGPVYTQLIVPPGGYALNNLYVSYAPQTVAGCNLYANLPLWMNAAGSGNIWFYEWYPSGYLDINYAGYAYYPGWFKRWFYADMPGWHILQFYCGGWSNYVYIYVFGSGDYSYWVSPESSYRPTPLPYVPVEPGPLNPFPTTGHTYYKFSYTSSKMH
jgi:hypothetical protein